MTDKKKITALDYPYEQLSGSYIFSDQGERLLSSAQEKELFSTARDPHKFISALSDLLQEDASVTKTRTAVLAIGSNASPYQLQNKFNVERDGFEGKIAVLKCAVQNYASVYCTFYTFYGAVPSTLTYVDGHKSSAFMTFLLPDQLETMNKTEGLKATYSLEKLQDFSVSFGATPFLKDTCAYFTQKNAFYYNQQMYFLKEYSASNANTCSQRDIQLLYMDLLNIDGDVESHISKVMSNPKFRKELSQKIKERYGCPVVVRA